MKRIWRFGGWWRWRWVVAAAGLVPLTAVSRHRELPPIAAVAYSPDGRALATASYGVRGEPPRMWAEVRVWDLAARVERRADRRSLDDVALVVGGEDRLVARAGGRTVPLDEVTSWPLGILFGGRGYWAFQCITAADPTGRLVATAGLGADRTSRRLVQTWDVATGRLARTLDPAGPVGLLAWSADGRTLAGVNGTLSVWDVESGAVLGWGRGSPGGVAPLAFAPTGGMLAYQALGAKLTCLDAGSGRVGPTFSFLQADALAFAPDGKRLAVADDEGQAVVTVFDLETGRPVSTFRGHERPSDTIEEARRLTGNAIGGLQQRTGINLNPILGELMALVGNTICAVAFSPDGRLAASGDADGTARVWDAATGVEVARFDHGAGASWRTLGPAAAWAGMCLVAASWRRRRQAGRGAELADPS